MRKALFISVSCFLSLCAAGTEQAPVFWEGALPSSHIIDMQETPTFVDTGRSEPQSVGLHFSREPYPAYVNPKTGDMIIEYTLPSESRNGPTSFFIEVCHLSPDGTELTVHRQRVFASPGEARKSICVFKVQTTKPYQFSIDGKYFVFEVRDSEIKSCKLFRTTQGQESPTFRKQIYPSTEWTYGVLSPV